MACTDYLNALSARVITSTQNLNYIFCSSQPTNVDNVRKGRYTYQDNKGGFTKGLYYQPSRQGNGGYKNIETGVTVELNRYLRDYLGQTYSTLGYAVVRRATDLDHNAGTTRLYPGDRVYFGPQSHQSRCRGGGTGRSWIRCWGYSKGSGVTETFGGYILDPYSNSRSYRRLRTW